MKNLMYCAWAMLLLCSCRKVDDLYPPPQQDNTSISSGSAPVENLGHIFTGTNVSWKIHPQDPNNSPLFTYSPYQQSGYCMVMIDNGKLDGRTPTGAFKLVVVDFQSFTSKVVTIQDQNGGTVTSSVGKVVKSIFGMDKNLYIATEGSAGGGGNLIRYNPNTQTAVDLGKPFNSPAGYLGIYTLNTGTDGALYGGSFGGDGQVYTFRYDYNTMTIDQHPIDNTSRYVTSISGDSRFTYVTCGKNNWFLYAIDRQTGEKRTLKCNPGPAIPLTLDSYTDAVYAQSQATHIKLDGFICNPLPPSERPGSTRVEYVPYDVYDDALPKVMWSDAESRVAYRLSNGQTGYINVTGLEQDVYPSTGPAVVCDNKVFLSSDKQGVLGVYVPGSGFQKIGSTSMAINSIAVPPIGTPDNGKIFLGGYPKGLFMEYSTNSNWSINLPSMSGATNNGFGTSSSNPSQRAMFQNPDASGVYGSMSLLALGYTKSGYVAGAGNNDRITSSSGRELSMGSYRNGSVRNLYLPEFSNYEYMSMCLSYDSNYAYVCATPHGGNVGRIYKYDPAGNQVVASWNLPLWGDNTTSLLPFNNDLLIGYCGDVLYLFDTNTGQIVWKQCVGNGQRIYSIATASNGTVYVNHMYRSVNAFRITKYNVDARDRGNVQSTSIPVADYQDADNDERYKPIGMLMGPSTIPGRSELFITGLPSLYKVSL